MTAAVRRRRPGRSARRRCSARRQRGIELQRHLLRDEEAGQSRAASISPSAFHVPVVATNGVRFAEPADRPLYDVLTCIRHKTTLARAGRRLSWNAERYLKPPEAMARLFADMPEAIAGARELADRLDYTMADLGYRFPEYPVPRGRNDGVVPAEDHAGGRARALSAVSRPRPRGRSSASWI